MNKREKIFLLSCLFAGGMGMNAGAMHIMEGFLPKTWSIFWFVLCIPFVVIGFRRISQTVKRNSRNLTMLALCGAFAFVLSALKLPSVSGSCSHPTGVGLGAILFGPCATAILGLIVLLFQAVLLAHGGLSTLGANVFSMAIVGPLIAFGVFKLLKKLGIPSTVCVFAAAALGDLLTYLCTSFQLAMAFPGDSFVFSLAKFMGIFAITQIPLAISEGLLTVLVYNVLAKYSRKELAALGAL